MGNDTNSCNDEHSTSERPFLCFVRMIFYTRYSILTTSTLVFLAILPWLFPNPTITAVYLHSGFIRMVTLTWMSFLAAALSIMTFRATLFNAVERFRDKSMADFSSEEAFWVRAFRRWSLYVFGLPIPVSCFLVTWLKAVGPGIGRNLGVQAVGLSIGLLLAITTLWTLNQLHRWILTPQFHDARFFPNINPLIYRRHAADRTSAAPGISLRLGRWLARRLEGCGFVAGYLRKKTYQVEGERASREVTILAVGHGPLAVFTVCLFAVNWGILFFGKHAIRYGYLPDDKGPFGTLAFLLGLVMLIAGILPGLSFFFDRFRVPVSWFVALCFLLVLLINYFFPSFIVDHAYDIAPLPHYQETANDEEPTGGMGYQASPLSIEDVIAGWELRQNRIARETGRAPNRNFVIVTAAGGGIQASGWTTTAFQGLSLVAPDLFGGIGVISSVSGGSVGTLYLISRYQEIIDTVESGDLPTRRDLTNDMVDQSTRSSLEAVGFGLLFPDTWRQFGFFVRDPTYDRGWVQQQVWASRMDSAALGIAERSDWRLGHLAAGVKAGRLPAVVFNGFSTTTGQRVWYAPFVVRKPEELRRPEDFVEFSAAVGMQLPLAAAARLSATFPYVSPTAVTRGVGTDQASDAPLSLYMVENSHHADGGYTDNEGLLTALEIISYLEEYFDTHEDCPFDRILLLRIAPIPPGPKINEHSLAKNSDSISIEKGSAYGQGLFGPVLGLYHGRIVTQIERGELELDLTQEFFDLRKKVGNLDEGQNVQIRRMRETKQVELKSIDDGKTQRKPLEFSHHLVDFQLERNGVGVSPPLSWKLSPQQVMDLTDAWKGAEPKLRDMLQSLQPQK